MSTVIEDISLSVNEALGKTQVRNKINKSCDMTYFGKQEIILNSCRQNYLQISRNNYDIVN